MLLILSVYVVYTVSTEFQFTMSLPIICDMIKTRSPNPAPARAMPDQVIFSHADRVADKVLL